MGLFDQAIAEIKTVEGIRYILRRNPARAEEIASSRQERLQTFLEQVAKQNKYLQEHPRSKVLAAINKLKLRCGRLKISKWVSVLSTERVIAVNIDEEMMKEQAKLDGCYVLKSDLSEEIATKETIHSRYKDLSYVESAFRSAKTVNLELRPIHVRLAARTRGHVFVVMMAYRIIKELAIRWQSLNVTVAEGIAELSTVCVNEVLLDGERFNQIPQCRESVKRLIDAAQVRMPEVLPGKGVTVTTKKKLPSARKSK
jgi:hypothetical protein